MTKEQFLNEGLELMREMTPSERGELIADLFSISMKLAIDDGMSSTVKDVFENNKEGRA